jgi:hypothetical protein
MVMVILVEMVILGIAWLCKMFGVDLELGFQVLMLLLGQLTVLSLEGTRHPEEGRLMKERNLIKGKERGGERERYCFSVQHLFVYCLDWKLDFYAYMFL